MLWSPVRGCAILFLLAAATSLQAADKPNVLFIVGDDMGFADVGFNGCQEIPTPNLDALATSGIRFTNGYVSGPYCSPTRAGLMTGRYQTRFGHEFNPSGQDGLPLDQKLIAARLKQAGYRTGLSGKWHLGSNDGYHPLDRGFDEFFGFLGGAHDYFRPNGILRNREAAGETGYLTDEIGKDSVRFIKANQDKPWFLYVAFNAVHTPMQADDARLKRFAGIADEKRRTYAAMMLAMDEAIGSILKAVNESGQQERTLIAFISDNGGPTMKGTTTNASINTPFRGSKRTTLEGGIHVPFLLSWQGKLKPGTFDHPVIQLDLTATALQAAGVETPAELDGVSLLPHLTGQTKDAPHSHLFWRFGEQMAVRDGQYKLVKYDSNADTNSGERRQPVSPERLYDLKADPGESKDLSADKPEVVARLKKAWAEWDQKNVAPKWGGQHLQGRGE